ncbi:MAG TPA: hypothetical protein VMK13_10435 [Streptosporangiaceae bacterium]|nr:hypothetical protein [Streptosporangiaceae bacterium]
MITIDASIVAIVMLSVVFDSAIHLYRPPLPAPAGCGPARSAGAAPSRPPLAAAVPAAAVLAAVVLAAVVRAAVVLAPAPPARARPPFAPLRLLLSADPDLSRLSLPYASVAYSGEFA